MSAANLQTIIPHPQTAGNSCICEAPQKPLPALTPQGRVKQIGRGHPGRLKARGGGRKAEMCTFGIFIINGNIFSRVNKCNFYFW